jgi:PhzF family phenazine biosynthesis protein
MPGLPLHQVDAFSERAFAGNPAAVCLLAEEADPAWMQAVASEMNLSETAFLLPEGPPGAYGLRWFTPAVEVELCGHATLASAHVLWSTGSVAPDAAISFSTLSGTLTAARDGELIAMDFPAAAPEPADPPAGLSEALGVTPAWVGRTLIGWFVEVSSPEEVARADPHMDRLTTLPGQGVILTAAGGIDGADVTSRYFAPAAGIPEDPVTGAAHCALGPFWSERLGSRRLVCHQASRRGGIVYVEVWGERVGLAGRAVTVMEGRLTV